MRNVQLGTLKGTMKMVGIISALKWSIRGQENDTRFGFKVKVKPSQESAMALVPNYAQDGGQSIFRGHCHKYKTAQNSADRMAAAQRLQANLECLQKTSQPRIPTLSSEPFWSQIWWSKQWLQIQCRAGAIFCWTWIGYTKTRSNASKQVVLVQKAPQRKHMFFLRAMLGVQIRGPSPCWGNIISSWFLVPSMACPRKYSYVRWVWGDLVIECFFSNDSPPLVA